MASTESARMFEYHIPMDGMAPGSGTYVPTLKQWLQDMQIPKATGFYHPPAPATIKPPNYWLLEQDSLGRQSAKFNIWHNRYDRAKQLATWASAPEEDFIAAGYGKER